MAALREQPMWHMEIGDRSYEFTQVYEPDRAVKADGARFDRRVDGLCYWTILRLDVERDDPRVNVEARSISYDEYRDAYGDEALSFAAFASPLLGPAVIDDWVLNRGREPRPRVAWRQRRPAAVTRGG
jgi:hypothetical protein